MDENKQYDMKKMTEKQKYEELINDSILFSLDRETQPYIYKRERNKMITYLYKYLLAINTKEYEPFGQEIVEVAIRCINSYKQSQGVFLHYFNAAWKKEFARITRDNILDTQFRGIKITEQARRAIVQFIERYKKGCLHRTVEELYQDIAEKWNISIDKVRKIAAMHEVRVQGDVSGDEETNIWDRYSDGRSFEEELEIAEALQEKLKKIESVYDGLQERQKTIISDAITTRMLDKHTIEPSEKYRFISRDICEEYRKTGRVPTQRTLASRHNRSEASFSRTVNEFLEKLKIVFGKDETTALR